MGKYAKNPMDPLWDLLKEVGNSAPGFDRMAGMCLLALSSGEDLRRGPSLRGFVV